MRESDDIDLVQRCRAGDKSAFDPLVERYQRVLFNVAYRMVGDYEDARDLTQTALVKAYTKLHSYDPRFKFFSWIYRILINEALNHLERRKTHEPLDQNASLAAPAGPHEQLQSAELSRRVERALMQLDASSREVLVLRHFADLTYGEISSTLQIPEKTVKSRLYEARRRLAALWDDGAPLLAASAAR